MYLYQFYLILFSLWWTGAYAMHLTPSFNTYRSDLSAAGQSAPFAVAPETAVIANHAANSNRSSSSSSSSSLSSSSSNSNNTNHNLFISSSSRNNLIDRIVAAAKHQKSLQTPLHPPAPVHPLHDEQLASVKRWQQRMFEKRLRIREHRRTIVASSDTNSPRSRRDSQRPNGQFHGGGRFMHSSNHNQLFRPVKRKRFCSAQDPATLAFEAPTVFEGKVKSMSQDRTRNFSVTFEVVNKIKHHNGWELPRNVRLQFVRNNTIGCDIYRERFRERGYIKKDLELGKHYFLFVKQIDLGNFTIVGVPLKKNSNTTKGVYKGVSDNYGKSIFKPFFISNKYLLQCAVFL